MVKTKAAFLEIKRFFLVFAYECKYNNNDLMNH